MSRALPPTGGNLKTILQRINTRDNIKSKFHVYISEREYFVKDQISDSSLSTVLDEYIKNNDPELWNQITDYAIESNNKSGCLTSFLLIFCCFISLILMFYKTKNTH